MVDPSKYKPDNLGDHAALFWDDVVSTYQLRFDDLIVLGNACKEIDLIEQISDEAGERASLVATGYNGQDVADPLIMELRQHRTTLRQLLGQLKLPDMPGTGAGTKPSGESRQDVSEKARAAARARWDAVTG